MILTLSKPQFVAFTSSINSSLSATFEEHGHTSIPYNFKGDPQLGNWVGYIRKKKKEYDEFTANANTVDGNERTDGEDLPTKEPPLPPNMLTRDQIEKLESLDFAWILTPTPRTRYTWEERLEQLRQYHREHGTFRVPRTSGTLGEWLHKQRQLYNTNDERFMKHRYPKMLKIGFIFSKKPVGYQKSWDDRFEDLGEEECGVVEIIFSVIVFRGRTYVRVVGFQPFFFISPR